MYGQLPRQIIAEAIDGADTQPIWLLQQVPTQSFGMLQCGHRKLTPGAFVAAGPRLDGRVAGRLKLPDQAVLHFPRRFAGKRDRHQLFGFFDRRQQSQHALDQQFRFS